MNGQSSHVPAQLAALEAVEDLQEARAAYRAIEQLLEAPPDMAPLPLPVGREQMAALMRVLGTRFDSDLAHAAAAALKANVNGAAPTSTPCKP